MSLQRFWWGFAVAVCALTLAPGAAQEPKTAAEFYNRGVEWTAKGEHDKAIKRPCQNPTWHAT